MSRYWRVKGTLIFGLLISARANAADPWEFGALGFDDNFNTNNTLSHGTTQTHDLDEAGAGNDVDWMVVHSQARHSYEARIDGTNVLLGTCGPCGLFKRVNSSGAVLTDDISAPGVASYHRSVRWIVNAFAVDYLRVTGSNAEVEGPDHVYTIRFWDTTYSIPRWNSSGGQVTVLLIQSLEPITVTGNIDFYTAAGTLLFSQMFTLAPNQLFTLNTSTVPALAGLSGHAYLAHTAGYGGLAGKAVALEPATGFSFDTLMAPIPD